MHPSVGFSMVPITNQSSIYFLRTHCGLGAHGSLQEGRCVGRYHVVGDSSVVRVLWVDCFSVAGQKRNELKASIRRLMIVGMVLTHGNWGRVG